MVDQEINAPGYYRVEVSGWGMDNSFFLEQTNLRWFRENEAKVSLRRAVREGAIVFLRLVKPESETDTLPVTYRVSGVQPMSCHGLCEMHLTRLHPRSKESIADGFASNLQEEQERRNDSRESPKVRALEEVLQ